MHNAGFFAILKTQYNLERNNNMKIIIDSSFSWWNDLDRRLAFSFTKLYEFRGGLNGAFDITGDDFDLYMKTWSMGGKFKSSKHFDDYLKALTRPTATCFKLNEIKYLERLYS